MDQNEAFVNAMAMAHDEHTFTTIVRSALRKLGFDTVDLEDPEPLRLRLESWTVDQQLIELAEQVRATGEARFGPFYTWVEDDE